MEVKKRTSRVTRGGGHLTSVSQFGLAGRALSGQSRHRKGEERGRRRLLGRGQSRAETETRA